MTLNAVDPKISFTVETENNGQISFLDTLITRKNEAVTIGVYRKPTHTDRYLDFNSHHELKHKISTASTLLNRALNLPSTAKGVRKELTYVSNALKSNGYPSATISKILKKKSTSEAIPSPEELVGMFFKWTDPPDSQIGFHQIGKGMLSTKSPVPAALEITSEKRVDAYTLQKKEHIRNTKVFKNGSNIASHGWLEGHTIDFENARVIERGNSRVRKTLESWHTAITSHADNNSKQLPRQYSILL